MRAAGCVRQAGIFIVVSVAAGFICEGALHVIGYDYTPLRIKILGNGDSRVFHAFEDSAFIYDPVLFWRPKTSDPSFNSQGYRGRALSREKRPDACRIFALGDSNTLGWGGQDGSNWPLELEALLQQDDELITVTNAGVWAYSSFQGLQRFKEALAWKPDIVLVSFGANDGLNVVTSDATYARTGLRRLYLAKRMHSLRVGQLLLSWLDRVSLAQDNLVPRVDVESYNAHLTEIVRLATERGIQVILLTRPFIHESRGALHHPPTDRYNAATKQLGEQLSIPVIDLYAYFDGQPAYFGDQYHFNQEGNRLAAKVVYEHLRMIAGIPKRRDTD